MATRLGNADDDLVNLINDLPAELRWGHIFPRVLPEDIFFQMRVRQSYGSRQFQAIVRYAVHAYDCELLNNNTKILALAPLAPFLPGTRRNRLVSTLLRNGMDSLKPEIITHILLIIEERQLARACTYYCATGRVWALLGSRSLVERFNPKQRQAISKAIFTSLKKRSDYKIVQNLLLSFDLWDKKVQCRLRDGILGAIRSSWTRNKCNPNLRQSFQSAIEYMDLDHFRMVRKLLSPDLIKEASTQNKIVQQLTKIDCMMEASLVDLLDNTPQQPDSFEVSRVLGTILAQKPRLSSNTQREICELLAHHLPLWGDTNCFTIMQKDWISVRLLEINFLGWYLYASLSDIILAWVRQDRVQQTELLRDLLTTGLSQHPFWTIDVLDVLDAYHLSKEQRRSVREHMSTVTERRALLYRRLTSNNNPQDGKLGQIWNANEIKLQFDSSILQIPHYQGNPWRVVLERRGKACAILPSNEVVSLLVSLNKVISRHSAFWVFDGLRRELARK